MSTKNENYVLTDKQGDAEVAVPGYAVGKQGHKCCGGCCDVKRAVIVVNLVSIGLGVLGFMSVLAMTNGADLYDDDATKAAFEEFNENLSMGALIAVFCIKLVCNICGVVGAMQYQFWLVGIAAAAYAFDIVISLVGFNIVGVVVAALFLYPHVFLIKEIRSGVMSAENYPNEAYSCCCV